MTNTTPSPSNNALPNNGNNTPEAMPTASETTPPIGNTNTEAANNSPTPTPCTRPLSEALSNNALAHAWEHVNKNGGAAGTDHQTLAAFSRHLEQELQHLRDEVESGNYSPQPLQLIGIPKRHGGQRLLAIPAVRDRVLQTAVAHLIGPHLDDLFGPDSYGYRPGRSVAQAIARVQAYRDVGLVHVVDADIQSFFDEINHRRLLQLLKTHVADNGIVHLVEMWLNAVLWEHGKIPRLQTKGVAQGSPLSPLLSNLYLDALDHELQTAGLAVVRYADDFVVLCADAITASQALGLVRQTLQRFKLRLNEHKTRLSSFEAGFDFLGVRFRQHHVEAIDESARPWLLPKRVNTEPQCMPTPEGPYTEAEPLPSNPLPSESTAFNTNLMSLDPALDDVFEEQNACIGTHGQAANTTPEPNRLVKTVSAERADPLLQSLYVGQPGCWISKSHDRIVVSAQHKVLASVPIHQVDQIAVFDNAMISTAVLRHCAQHRVRVCISGWSDQLLTLERGGLGEQRLLQAQWQAQEDASLSLLLASGVIQGKLHNSRVVLRRFSRHQGRKEIEGHIQAIERLESQITRANDLNQIRGLEGQAARQYFQALRVLLPIGVDFPGRNRRPPRDPINTSLSFGYAVLAHNVHTLIRMEGLNAHMGHLHVTNSNSMALVSDLIEEFRAPLVDSLVLNLWRQGQLTDADFEWSQDPDELPCRLRSSGRHLLLDGLENKMESQQIYPKLNKMLDFRRIMQAQVRHYIRVLLRREPIYQAFKLR